MELVFGIQGWGVNVIEYKTKIPSQRQIELLYSSVIWTIYLRDINKLMGSFANSVYITAWNDDKELVGLIRGITDQKTILFIQDLLVLQKFQRIGIATELFTQLISKFQTRQVVLLADESAGLKSFYQSLGMVDSRTLNVVVFYQDRQ